MNNLKKPFMTINEQLNRLEEKGLKIPDRKDAYNKLLQNNYYTVINGYKVPFLAPKMGTEMDQNAGETKEQYIKGSSFDELFALYKFDCNIRALFLKYILKVEHQLKSVISHSFAQNHRDEKYPAYLDGKNFDVNMDKTQKGKKEKQYEDFRKRIDMEIRRQIENGNEMLIHYEKNMKIFHRGY